MPRRKKWTDVICKDLLDWSIQGNDLPHIQQLLFSKYRMREPQKKIGSTIRTTRKKILDAKQECTCGCNVPKKGSPEALARGAKMVQTKVERGLIKPACKIKKQKNYNASKKNEFRKKVTDTFYNVASTLSLESPQWLFVKDLPWCHHYIFERDYATYCEMKRTMPSIVGRIDLYRGDVEKALTAGDEYHQAFLDFCTSIDSNIGLLSRLKPVLENCGYLAFSFCVRTGKSLDNYDIPDYKIRTTAVILSLFPEFEVIYGEVYSDTSPMFGIILRKKQDNDSSTDIEIPEKTKNEIVSTIKVEMKNILQVFVDNQIASKDAEIRELRHLLNKLV